MGVISSLTDWSFKWTKDARFVTAGLIFHIGNKGDCLCCSSWSSPLCPWKAPVEIYNFLIVSPLPRRTRLGALALSKSKHVTVVLKASTTVQHHVNVSQFVNSPIKLTWTINQKCGVKTLPSNYYTVNSGGRKAPERKTTVNFTID